MTKHHLHRLDLLILARLATAGKHRPSISKLDSELFRFVEARLSRREWSSQCAERLASLQAQGHLDERRVPTPAGLERLREALGVQRLPDTWKAIWQALVPALTLELPAAQWAEVAPASRLRARLIRQRHALELPPTPTLSQAVDAQAWRELGIERTDKLSEREVKLALMQQALGVPVRSIAEAVNAYCWTLLGEPPEVELSVGKLRRVLLQRTQGTPLRAATLDVRKVGERLATEAAGTTTGSADVLRRALVSRWLFADPAAAQPATTSVPTSSRAPKAAATPAPVPVPGPVPGPGPVPVVVEPPSLQRWASQVQALANALQTGRYGDERVFIAAAWRAAQAGPKELHEPLEAFKARLVQANREGLLRLHRADLVGAMDRALVHESETQHLNATFHFIETPARRTP